MHKNHRPDMVLIPQHFGSLVFDRRTSRYAPFDYEATQLLMQLHDEPFDALVENLPDTHYRDRAVSFFEDLYQRGYFTVDLKFAGDILDVDIPKDHMVGPLAVHLEVIAACNLRCTHCFAGELPRRALPLNLDELDVLFADLAAIGAFRLGLTGGEPLLRRDIFEVIDLATAHGLHPCITTNALLITEEIAREFGKRDLVWLNVSLEGATAATNDVVRGSGTFDAVMEKLLLLKKHSRFTVAFTVMSSNVDEVAACAELARKVGADTAVFRPLYPVGTALHNLELMPTFGQYNDALDKLSGIGEQVGFNVREAAPFSPRSRNETRANTYTNGGCGAGNLVCSVSVSGDVNPCSFLGAGYVGDNIRNRPFRDIWNDNEKFAEMRSTPTTASGKFDGGCRARSLAFNGSVHAPDPWVESARSRHFRHPLAVLQVNAG